MCVCVTEQNKHEAHKPHGNVASLPCSWRDKIERDEREKRQTHKREGEREDRER